MTCVRIPIDSTIASHVSGTTANTADDVCCEVPLLWTVVLAVPDTSAVLTDLVLVISEGTIERGKLAELVTLVIVLSFRCRGRLTDTTSITTQTGTVRSSRTVSMTLLINLTQAATLSSESAVTRQ